MTPDADRFRPRKPEQSEPRDRSAVSQQTPPSAPSAFGASYREPVPGQPRPHAQSPTRAQQGAPGARPMYAPPNGAPRYAAPSATQRYAPPAIAQSDAPLIHPAAAQVARYTPYGVPVYRTPVYAYAPAPQRGLSITAMVLGLCSVIFAWLLVVVPIIGLVFGFIALKREPAGKAMAVTGLITSALGLLWAALFFLLPVVGLLGTLLFGLSVP